MSSTFVYMRLQQSHFFYQVIVRQLVHVASSGIVNRHRPNDCNKQRFSGCDHRTQSFRIYCTTRALSVCADEGKGSSARDQCWE